MNKIIDGQVLAKQILAKNKIFIDSLQVLQKRIPAIAVIKIGNDLASEIYIRRKEKACKEVGIGFNKYNFEKDVIESKVIALINELNDDLEIDAILLQLPLPKHLNSKNIINNIKALKDVDRLNHLNMGLLTLNQTLFSPCTPSGIIYMLDSINFNYIGKNAVIIGASNIVGRPIALDLLNRGATVTICNSKTAKLNIHTQNADLIVIAIGKPRFLQAKDIKINSIIIDVGINRLSDGSICGDVDLTPEMLDKVAFISKVPGGVGPLTVAMLIQNTCLCYRHNK